MNIALGPRLIMAVSSAVVLLTEEIKYIAKRPKEEALCIWFELLKV